MSGTAISQIIPFFIAPIISRLYYPEDYAVVATYNSITVLLTIVATGMYSSALIIDETDEKAFNTGIAAFIVTSVITILSLIIFLIFSDSIAKLTGNENIIFWLYLIPLTVFFSGGYQTLNMWNNRKKRYKRLAANSIFQTIITSATTLFFGFIGWHATGFLISLLIGQAFAFLLLFSQTLINDTHLLKTANINGIKSSFITHIDFPKYNMPQGFLDGFRESSIVLIISNFFGASALGSYSFSMSILNKPVQFIGASFSQIFYQKASERYNSGKEIFGLTKKTIILLFIISLPIFLTLVIWGREIFIFVFGKNWEQAGYLSQILASWLFLKFIISPVLSIPQTLGKQKTFFFFVLIYNITMPLALLVPSLFEKSIIVALSLFTFMGVLNHISMQVWISTILKTKIKK